jgi:hypothetical protein
MGSHHDKHEQHPSQQHPDRGARCRGVSNLVRLVGLGLTVAAVVKEVRTPAADRTWTGVVAGFVPYDFRMPTLARCRDRLWAPESEHLLNPQVFGVGWTVNLGKVVALARTAAASAS